MNFWVPNLKELSANNSVIIFDGRGIGNTTIGNKPFTINQLVNYTTGLLDTLKINKKIDVIGFSIGYLTTQELSHIQHFIPLLKEAGFHASNIL